MKFDFLGLKTLTVIDDALRLVRQNHPEMKDFQRDGHPARRPGGLRAHQPRRHRRRLPDGVLRLHRDGDEDEALAVRGRHRRRRALPPRSARPEARGRPDDGGRLHRPQARARAGPLPSPRPREGPGADLRRHRLPGAGDADLAGPRAATASAAPTCSAARWGRRRPRRWRRSASASSRGRAARRCRREGRERHLRPDGEVRGVRLQQVALRRLRPPHRPDRVAEGPLPGRVHGRAHLERGVEHRQGRAPRRRGARRRASRCCRRT